MDSTTRLLELADGMHFPTAQRCETADALLKLAKQVDAECAKIGERGEDYEARLRGRAFMTLAETQLLLDSLAADRAEWNRLCRLALEALKQQDFDPEKLEAAKRLFDSLPYLLVEVIAQGMQGLALTPGENVAEIGRVLEDMIKEVRPC